MIAATMDSLIARSSATGEVPVVGVELDHGNDRLMIATRGPIYKQSWAYLTHPIAGKELEPGDAIEGMEIGLPSVGTVTFVLLLIESVEQHSSIWSLHQYTLRVSGGKPVGFG